MIDLEIHLSLFKTVLQTSEPGSLQVLEQSRKKNTHSNGELAATNPLNFREKKTNRLNTQTLPSNGHHKNNSPRTVSPASTK
jgi:ABC-type uncharacterized transport system involved in gliding motility auxiliary subunit